MVGSKVMLLSIIFVGLAQNPTEILKPEREHILSFPLFFSPSLLPSSLLLPLLPFSFSFLPFFLPPLEMCIQSCTLWAMLPAGDVTRAGWDGLSRLSLTERNDTHQPTFVSKDYFPIVNSRF